MTEISGHAVQASNVTIAALALKHTGSSRCHYPDSRVVSRLEVMPARKASIEQEETEEK